MRRALPPFAFLLLGACTVGPNYSRPATPVPPAYSEPHSAAGLGDNELGSWWNAFSDPELDRLVNRAIAQNLDVENAAARIREARAEERAAGAAALPKVSATGSVTRQRISENAIPVPPGSGGGGGAGGGSFGLPGSEFTTWRAGFDASWEIDLFGRTRRAVEAAKARTGAAIWSRRDVQVSTAAEGQERSQSLVSARVRGGLVTGQDLEQQSSELKTARAAIPPLRAQADAQ